MPPGDNPIAVNKYIIIIKFRFSHERSTDLNSLKTADLTDMMLPKWRLYPPSGTLLPRSHKSDGSRPVLQTRDVTVRRAVSLLHYHHLYPIAVSDLQEATF